MRKQDRTTLPISGGFSCRYQIKHGAGRWPLHPAEVILMARRLGPRLGEGPVPEDRFLEPTAQLGLRDAATVGALTLGATALFVGGAALVDHVRHP